MVSVRLFKTQVLMVGKIAKRLGKERGSFPFINSLFYRMEYNYKGDCDVCLVVKSGGRLLASIPLDWDSFNQEAGYCNSLPDKFSLFRKHTKYGR